MPERHIGSQASANMFSRLLLSRDLCEYLPSQQGGAGMTEIEVESVGAYRLPNEWQYGPPRPATGRETPQRGLGLRTRHDGPPVRQAVPGQRAGTRGQSSQAFSALRSSRNQRWCLPIVSCAAKMMELFVRSRVLLLAT